MKALWQWEADKNKSSAVAEMGDRGHNRHWMKRGRGLLCPFCRGRAGSPCNTMRPGPRPTVTPRGILISEEHVMVVMNNAQPVDPTQLPCVTASQGSWAEHQWHLFESIRPLLPAVGRDIIYPQPQVDKCIIARPSAETVMVPDKPNKGGRKQSSEWVVS